MPLPVRIFAPAAWPRSAIAWLTLSLVLLWSSGTARALHERFEHHHPVLTSAGATVATDLDDDDAPAGATSPAPLHPHHDACATCAMLAAMAAVIVVFVQFLTDAGPVLTSRRTIVRAPRRATFLPATPTTGPPMLAC